MKASDPDSNNKSDAPLEFPRGGDYNSTSPAKVSFAKMMELSAKNLPRQFADPEFEEQRLRSKVLQAFEL